MSTIDPDDLAYDPAYQKPPTEKKVTAATFTATSVVGLLVAVLSLVEGDQLVEGLPDWVSVLVAMLISAGGTFLAGRSAPHTPRPDLPPEQR